MRNDHTICDDNTRSALGAGIKTSRVTAVHGHSLFVSHVVDVLDSKTELSPVLEDVTSATVSDELVRELSNTTIEVVADHELQSLTSSGACRVAVEGISLHFPADRAETVHVDVTIATELLSELRSKLSMELLREVTEGISQSSASVVGAQNQGASWCMRHRGIELLHWRRHGLKGQSLSHASAHCSDILLIFFTKTLLPIAHLSDTV